MNLERLDGSYNTYGTECDICRDTYQVVFRIRELINLTLCGKCIDRLKEVKDAMNQFKFKEVEL